MKKIYQKPNLKSVKLISESALLQASNFNMGGTIEGDTSQALSNEEESTISGAMKATVSGKK